ncbi:MAG: ATP-binding cassette domain-containing protein, partial [Clostridia bacterium]|nr:ATP-binding cassette domain-containing protein [Clostridia bacterium]
MLLELRNISKSFGEKQVLKGISFKAQSGKAFGLLGRNGAGKTTTIRILMNVFPPDSGKVLIDGKPLDYDRIGIGYLPEERGLYPKKTILDQLVYFSVLKGMSRKQAVSAIDMWLERLEMTEYRNRRLDTLSKGNQQKIQLITALAHDPDIIILDEPFSGLDPVNAMMLKNVVREQLQKGKIVLFSSHQMSYIEEFCDS